MRRHGIGFVLAALVSVAAAAPAAAQYTGVEPGSFYSAANRRNLPYNIYLPPGYQGGNDRYPVIYWFHGVLQDQNSGLRITTYLHEAISAGDLPPMLLVLGTDGHRAATGYKDWPLLGDYGEQAVLELIAHVDATFRTLAAREYRAIEGLSMGGLGAMCLACKYPDLFCSALSTGGALADAETFWLATENAERLRGRVAFKLCIGSLDTLTWLQNLWFGAWLLYLDIPHGFEIVHGAIHTIPSYYQILGASTFAFHAACFYGR